MRSAAASCCSAVGRQLFEAVQIETADAIERELALFVEAWPNASRGDLAGYGAQLAQDVADRQPCRYALRSELRQLRQTSRFLPNIAEVLAALDDAQGRIRNTNFPSGEASGRAGSRGETPRRTTPMSPLRE